MARITGGEYTWPGLNLGQLQSLDPLQMDASFVGGGLAQMNANNDANGLVEVSRRATENFRSLDVSCTEADLAVARDLGLLAGSMLRVNVDVEQVTPEVVGALMTIADKTDMIPYHTVFHYSLGNPDGPRMRTFTKSEQEKLFVEQVRIGMEAFGDAALSLGKIFCGSVDIKDEGTAFALREATNSIELGIQTIPTVMKQVGGRYFAEVLRPYFNPLIVDGVSYDAPGGAQMPLMVVDHMLFASDLPDNDYGAYRAKNIGYLTPSARRFMESTMGQSSLKTRRAEMSDESQLELDGLLKKLYAFRAAHHKLAKDSFSHRDQEAVGSGGARPDLLQDLTHLTHSQIH
ncbi:MAG: monodechloroaminopyrrolnitrin synthase PrnB family protein [Patescibacteria group bacterium]